MIPDDQEKQSCGGWGGGRGLGFGYAEKEPSCGIKWTMAFAKGGDIGYISVRTTGK